MTEIEYENALREHREVIKYMQQVIQQERAVAKAATDAANKIAAASTALGSMGYGTGLGKAGVMNRYATKTINQNFYTKMSLRPSYEGFYLCVGSQSATYKLIALGLTK